MLKGKKEKKKKKKEEALVRIMWTIIKPLKNAIKFKFAISIVIVLLVFLFYMTCKAI